MRHDDLLRPLPDFYAGDWTWHDIFAVARRLERMPWRDMVTGAMLDLELAMKAAELFVPAPSLPEVGDIVRVGRRPGYFVVESVR